MIPTPQPHIPVMIDEVIASLMPADGEIYVDGTFGAGGYTKKILDAADCKVIAIDRDHNARERAQELQESYGDRLIFLSGCFGDADIMLRDTEFESVDGFVLDLGVSSMQLDEAERGFSFRFDGPLDMRMDVSGDSESAADIVNHYREEDLADIIYQYGEERHSRRIARAIVKARSDNPITRTLELADIVRSVVPRSRKDNIDPATRTFQALRIAVNRELDELRRGLKAAENILKQGGRLVVVSFHSLEDSIVKKFMNEKSGKTKGISRHLPPSNISVSAPTFKVSSSKALLPSAAESAANSRSRSAKLRVATRTENRVDKQEANG